MRKRSMAWCALLIVLTACSAAPPHRAQFSGDYPAHDCPGWLEGAISVSADARPASIHSSALLDASIATTGAVGRSVSINAIPTGLGPKDRVIWSSTTLSTYGGTLAGWARLKTDFADLSPTQDEVTNAHARRAGELLDVRSTPGQLRVLRSAQGDTNLLGGMAIDLLVWPGGVVVDDTVVRVPKLWTAESPMSPGEVALQLTPVRHPPGYDIVVANVQLDYVARLASTRDEWTCSTETRVTLVDQDAVRAPFWDIGPARPNAGRREWLALFEPSTGAVRAMFESPAAANALVSWIQATGATAIGGYTLGLFKQSAVPAGRPFGHLGPEAMATFRPLTVEDARLLRVGPVGEP